MSSKTSKKLVSCLLVLVMLLPASLVGCKTETNAYAPDKPQWRTVDVDAIKAKYEGNESVTYAESGLVVERDHHFTIDIGFDPFELGLETYDQIAALYFDTELTQTVLSLYEWANEDKTAFIIAPWEYPDRSVYNGGQKGYEFGFDADPYRLFARDDYADWGNTGTMYLATWRNLSNGELLDKPLVQVVTIKGELETPDLSLEITNDGIVTFKWDKVAGAEAYYIIEFTTREKKDGSRQISSGGLIGHTTGTQWSSDLYEWSDSVFGSNIDFRIYRLSEDDRLDDSMYEAYKDEFDSTVGPLISEDKNNRFFAVMAVNAKGCSMYSRLLDVKDIAALAPHLLAYNMQKLSGEGGISRVQGVNNMPAYQWIVLCNGMLSQRIVNYDFDALTVETTKWFRYEEVIEDGEWYSVDILELPYQVDGTLFDGTCIIYDYDVDNWESQLQQIEKRQNILRSKTGDVKRDVVIDDETVEPGPGPDQGGGGIVDNQTIITANCALSEYLAIQMIDGVKAIDISAFNEAINSKYLIDAFSEALHQNPLILGVSGARVSTDNKTLYPLYEDDQTTRESKQNEIVAEVSRVVPLIITASMSPLEKEFAINQYLCDTVEYDMAALDNAALYDFRKVDSQYYDSFTAYGALINGVGVCASYAAAFKLLADAAGLDCVVVTGYLNGSMSHAWNRVKLADGIWAAIDVTNNDNEYMPNVLVNVPDSAAAAALVEDDAWIMDSVKSLYSNEVDTNEYYRVVGLFFDGDEVVNQIVDQLKTSDIAVVRTDYMLTEAQFYDIAKEVLLRTDNYDLAGIYWMGLILITSDISIFE